MNLKKTGAGLTAGAALILGTIDASVLNEQPLERVETIANERVEAKQIGNIVETTFPWKGEPGFKVKYDMGEPTASERLADKRKREVITETLNTREDELNRKKQQLIAYKSDIQTKGTSTKKIDGLIIAATSTQERIKIAEQEIWSIDEDLQINNGFKVDILLNEKPDTNVFCYAIEGAENYDFFYQPPLTTEEIEQGAERPEDIVGSYAVYHKTLKNHQIGAKNYATGKVIHIPRPQVWEVGNKEGTTEWASLSYTEATGKLCVTVSQPFLNSAQYPVRVDPTLGYSSIGGTQTNDAGSTIYGQVSATEGGTLTDISIYCTWNFSGDGTIASAWYTDSSGDPDSKQYTTTGQEVCVSGTPGWRSGSLTGSFTGSADYWIGMHQGGGPIGYYYDTGGTSETNDGFDALPATATPTDTNTNRNYSVYVTYTAAPGEERRIFMVH